MRVLFFGMQGQFTQIVFERLLIAGVDVCGLLLSGPEFRPLLPSFVTADPFGLPLLDSFVEPNALHLAWHAGIPVYESGPLAKPDLPALIRDLGPDVACVACFDRIIPARLLALPRHGILNVHPSLLPDFRGPEPLFWQLRAGINPVGVTVHWMDSGLDTGDIAGQRMVSLSDGISGMETDARCAEAGGQLLVGVLDQLANGQEERRIQPTPGSYQPAPGAADFCLDQEWEVRRAFNFMRGTVEWGMAYPVTIHGDEWHLIEALDWEAGSHGASPIKVSDRTARIAFIGGTLTARMLG